MTSRSCAMKRAAPVGRFWAPPGSSRELACSARRRPPSIRSHSTQVVTCAAVGIDLGTTSSMIAIIKGGMPVVLPDAQGRESLPSLVSYGVADTGDMVAAVGWDAMDMELCDASTVSFHSVKRFIGRRLEDVESFCHKFPFETCEDATGALSLQYAIEGLCQISKRPEDVSAMVLKELLSRAESVTGDKIDTAVVAVPAHFGPAQKEATKLAGKLAGLKHVELLQEPVAAALASGIMADDDTSNTVLVFDLGGGTFDVSILDISEGIMEVLSTDGNSFLGGDNWDEALMEWVLSALSHTADDQTLDAQCNHAWRTALRKAKEDLSQAVSIEVPVPVSEAHSRSRTLQLSRREMEDICHPLLEQLWPPLARIGADTMLKWDKTPEWATPTSFQSPADQLETRTKGDLIDAIPDKYAPPPRRVSHVVLAGAATTMPAVLQLVYTITGIHPELEVDPQESVALGAAVHAGLLSGELQGGIELMDGGYIPARHDGRNTGFHGKDRAWSA